jgi:hypothetical protein
MSSPVKTLFTPGHLAKSARCAAAGLAILISPWTANAAFVQATANARGREAWIQSQPVPSDQTQIQELNTPGTAKASLSGNAFAASASATADFGVVQVSVSGRGIFPDAQTCI